MTMSSPAFEHVADPTVKVIAAKAITTDLLPIKLSSCGFWNSTAGPAEKLRGGHEFLPSANNLRTRSLRSIARCWVARPPLQCKHCWLTELRPAHPKITAQPNRFSAVFILQVYDSNKQLGGFL